MLDYVECPKRVGEKVPPTEECMRCGKYQGDMTIASHFMRMHLGGNMNVATLTPFAIQEMMEAYAKNLCGFFRIASKSEKSR